jgi:PEP-CTERM motif/NHL repeat
MTGTSSGGITLSLNNSFGGFGDLNGIGVDSAGNILTADGGFQRVRKYSQSGVQLNDRFLGGALRDVTEGVGGKVFVTNDSQNRIHRLNGGFGLESSPSSPSAGPAGITTLSNGSLVVADYFANRIYTVNPSGFGVISNFTTLSADPFGVATTNVNQILVADPNSNRLRRFSSGGAFQLDKSFADPTGVATDNAGNVYLADGNTQRIRVLNSSLIEQSSVVGFGFAEDVAFASNGRLIASAGNQIRVFDTGFTASGSETIANGTVLSGDLIVTSGNSVTISGSATVGSVFNSGTVTVGSGATLTDTVAFVENGGVFALDGTLNSGINNNSGGTLTGSGTVNGTLAVNDGSTLAPGNSPGTMAAGNTTFGAGGTFELEVNDFAGTAGGDPGWDLLAVTGTLDITSTVGNPFIVDVNSLTLANAAGNAVNFDDASNFALTFVTTTGGITGFAANLFSIDTSGFTNAFTGVFSIAQLGNDLALQYTAATAAVPEPSSFAILGLALIGFGITYQRKRRRAATDA